MANPTVSVNGRVTAVEPYAGGTQWVSITPTELTSLGGGQNERNNAGVILGLIVSSAQAFTVGAGVTIAVTQTAVN